MNYQVLARKYRPHNFQEMVGQEAILRILTNALAQKRIHHAYLLTGTRGVGKTTLARILAKCLNCETNITETPCGTCSTCIAIDKGQFLDLYEVDAASRTKVEDTRELLENVLYPPTQGRYKIYLIDEVHMLSNHSFNALLKTLEEPPEHVKFLLATTDPKRLPITILSRCLQFHLKRIPHELIAKHLQSICSKENIEHDMLALEKLAKAADGSMRDALSLMDQAIAYGHGAVNKNDVNAMLGSLAQDDLIPLLSALADQDGKAMFSFIEQLAERAPDFNQVLEELISIFHQMAIVQIVPEAKTATEEVIELSKRFAPEDVQIYYQIALLGRRDLALAPQPQQGVEMTMLRMLAFKPCAMGNEKTSMTPLTPISTSKPETSANKHIEKKMITIAPPATENKIIEEKSVPALSSQTIDWRNVLPKLKLSGMAYALASNCSFSNMVDNTIELALSANHHPMLNQKLKERIAKALSEYYGHTINLKISVTNSELATPLKQQQQEDKSNLENATQQVLEDPQIKKLIDMYDATVEVSVV